ncbi:GNAT family N-acetyltransferase [Geodermatophilus sp. TF02-6]|uniref:GNAT family N-acetyltransferase n=1 Tax=Geodermatophilus sp. TF02-6 TaxID=2250575 RepID=UPI001F309576|nr:GNAT family N-acetyltransferase [Geodermatophilus sp. TF02-6]
MNDGVLVHLTEPTAWRAGLDVGVLRPPSLATEGFVYLSTPEQVHLPAARLFPGRRDLVLLVVDRDRLREDPLLGPLASSGTPWRGPHLHGPLPVSAVVAVVPYRPPAEPDLPAPEDALGRALALQLSLRVRRAAEVRDVPGGVAVRDPRYPHSRDDNRLLLSSPVDAGTIEQVTAAVAADAGWPHRAATLRWAGAGTVAAQLARRGWEVLELLVMARAAEPLPGGERAEVVPQEEVHGLWERSWRRDLPAGADLDEVVTQLVGREHRNDAVVAVSDVVVREGAAVVSAGQLRVDGATAAVESVVTEPGARGRGHADAVLARLLTSAADAGCDLVVLEADAADWPQHWYTRRGFRVVGSTWEVAAS